VSLTRELTERIAAVRFETLGADCVARTRQAIKDGIAVALAGTVHEVPPRLVAAHLKSLGGTPQATVWGFGFKTSPVHAAYVNGVSTHVLDFEPMWLPPTHAVSPTVPVAVALAEATGANGSEIIAAVAKGMEVQGRIQFAADQYEAGKLRFHPPGLTGVIGAAVTAGHMIELDAGQLAHAIGIAASRAGALLANVGSMTKSTHCGYAGASGLDAALLASRGFTANPDVLEAPRGFATAFYPDGLDHDKLLAFGKPYRVVDPGLAIKLFPSQFATHWAITAALELNAKINDPAKIAHVRIRGPAMAYVDRGEPATGLEGKFSFQYTAAAALLDGKVGIDTFTDARRYRADMVALLGKIELVQDASIPGNWTGLHVTIDVELRDGAKFEARCRGPLGAWGRPALTPERHEEKLRDCLGAALDGRRATRLLGLLDKLEKQTARGIAGIAAILGGAGRATKREGYNRHGRRKR
jgi:aconitate decarboxylase